MIVGELALVAAAFFSGAAVQINVVEHPAWTKLPDKQCLMQWKPAYKRGVAMQASLAIIGCVLGVWAWALDSNWSWALGGLVLVSNWPFTLAVIMPVNSRLMGMDPNALSGDFPSLMRRWAAMHAVRSGIGLLATAILVWALHQR